MSDQRCQATTAKGVRCAIEERIIGGLCLPHRTQAALRAQAPRVILAPMPLPKFFEWGL